MSLRATVLAKYYYSIIERWVLPKIETLSIDPNQYTLLGMILSMFVPLAFYVHPLFGFMTIGLSGLSDSLDGLIARNRGMKTVYGAFLDSSADRISDFFYLLGFWILFRNDPRYLLAGFLVFLCLLFSFMISYVRAKAESLGGRCKSGLMERGWRTLYLIVWALLLSLLPFAFLPMLWAGLVIYLGLVMVTLLQRIRHVKAQFSENPDENGG